MGDNEQVEWLARKTCPNEPGHRHDPAMDVTCDWSLSHTRAVIAAMTPTPDVTKHREQEIAELAWDEGVQEGILEGSYYPGPNGQPRDPMNNPYRDYLDGRGVEQAPVPDVLAEVNAWCDNTERDIEPGDAYQTEVTDELDSQARAHVAQLRAILNPKAGR